MYRSGFWRGACLAAWLAGAVFLAACPGGDDDEGDADKDEHVDLIALVVAAFEEEPRRLPAGITLGEVSFEEGWDTRTIAVLDISFTGEGSAAHHASVFISRTSADARSLGEELREFTEPTESKRERGHFCFWDDFGIYLDSDGVSTCSSRLDTLTIEVESGPVSSTEPEAAMDLLLSLERYFKDLQEDATRRVREVPPGPLAAMLIAVNPPDPTDDLGIEVGNFEDAGVLATKGLVESISWDAALSDKSKVFFQVFDTPEAAEAHNKDYLISGLKPDALSCSVPSDKTYRYCAQQVGPVVIVAQRVVSGTSAPNVDPFLEAWGKELAAHVRALQSGKLPPALKINAPPNGAGTPTAPPATPTPTATALPTVTRFNAGTWTLDMAVKSNNCPGGLPAVGSAFQLQYEFTDVNDDGYIAANELFYIEQLLPGYQDIGTVSTPLKPSLSFVHLAKNGAFSGLATVVFTFVAEDRTIVDYTEEYAACRVTAVES